MKPVSVAFDLPESADPEIRYAFDLFARHFGTPYQTSDQGEPDLLIGLEPYGDIRVSKRFVQILEKGDYDQKRVFPEEPLIRQEDGAPDRLGTSFYMVNSLQEHGSSATDRIGRFPFEASYQYRFGSYGEDLVGQYFQELLAATPPLKKVAGTAANSPPSNSQLFLTHDIDRLNRGLIREGPRAFLQFRWGRLFRILTKEIKGRPVWEGIPEITATNRAHGYSATFFWIPRKGKDEAGIRNADYAIDRKELQELREKIEQEGGINGLHKSSFSDSALKDEIRELPFEAPINRNHYLSFRLPDHYKQLDEAGIPVDSSLGYPTKAGFRNSYGRPFQPFDMDRRQRMKVWEVPLTIMDHAFFTEDPGKLEEKKEAIAGFLEKHAKDRVITVLWHNQHLTPYRYGPMQSLYTFLLEKARELGLENFDPLRSINAEK